jgi:hypothetical protein
MGISQYIGPSVYTKPGVCTSTTRPAVPYTGQVIFETDTNKMLVWNTSAWVIPNSPAQNPQGLELVAATTFTTSSNPFINGCFSSTYDNYRILISLSTSASTNLRIRWRYGTSTTDTTAKYDRFGATLSGATVTTMVSTSETSFYPVSTTSGATELAPVTIDFYSPNVAIQSVAQSNGWNTSSGATHLVNCRMNNTTQYTGLELFVDSGTLTGSIRVYGYRNS